MSWAMLLIIIQMIVYSNQILLVFSFYNLCCIILTIGKQIIPFKKALLLPLLPQLKGRWGTLPPSPACLTVATDFSIYLLLCIISLHMKTILQKPCCIILPLQFPKFFLCLPECVSDEFYNQLEGRISILCFAT